MNPVRRLLIAGALAAAALSGGGWAGAAAANDGDMSLGNAKAKVTVIEYASVTCSHCAHWQETVYPAFKAKYVDTGQVRYVLRELPTQPFNLATAGFLAARCAGEERYFGVVEALMRSQPTLFATRNGMAWLKSGSGLDDAALNACLSDNAALDAFNARAEANAAEYNVGGTPAFVVNGRLLEGPPTLEDLDKAIQPLLAQGAKAKDAKAQGAKAQGAKAKKAK